MTVYYNTDFLGHSKNGGCVRRDAVSKCHLQTDRGCHLGGGTCAHRCTDAKLSLLSTEMPQTWSMLSVQFDWLSKELLVDMY